MKKSYGHLNTVVLENVFANFNNSLLFVYIVGILFSPIFPNLIVFILNGYLTLYYYT